MKIRVVTLFFFAAVFSFGMNLSASEKTRVIVTSDGEVDDECSMVRFLLYANELDVEGIITSSSQYHWQGYKWAGDDWAQPYLEAYAKIQPNLLKHDSRFPTAEYLKERTFPGNVKAAGDMEEETAGSQHIVKVLLDESDNRPVWLQAWGGTNTIARALKTIEEKHPEKMAYVANKIRLFLIWEQDTTYQDYIRTQWGRYNILTIISDQFIALFYHWKKYLPAEQQAFFAGSWMQENILENHGPLCSLYKANENGEFRSEGDSPAFLHTIMTGLRNLDNPDWGGWGGRYTRVRENTWLDPVAEPNYQYPEGRWYTDTAWGRERLRAEIPDDKELTAYLKPIWRWTEALQNDFASRADWGVKSYEEANHPPVVVLDHARDIVALPGATIHLSVKGSSDPDGDSLVYKWWQYREAGSYEGSVEILNADKPDASFTLPADAGKGQTIHLIAEVSDSGTPSLTRYQRVIVSIPRDPVVRIMPLGDSITWDNRRKDRRPIGVRIAYRKTLHDLLKSAGYAFDFVGSENAGDRYLGYEMDDNAGFPGITDDQLATLISTGYAQHTSFQVTPGPYLETHPADIILLHIGTNRVEASADDVADILDNIRESDPDVYIIIARIINRFPYSEVTTAFNNNVEAMVKARADNRLVMVDMESGAGIDYYTDMDDDLHPNHLGYDKMASIWYDAIIALGPVGPE